MNNTTPSVLNSVEARVCNSVFKGNGINLHDCEQAIAKLPPGSRAEHYSNNSPWPYAKPDGLPLMVSYGSCAIKFEASGLGATLVPQYLIIPDDVRAMASALMQVCVGRFDMGGFLTKRLFATETYLQNPERHVDFNSNLRKELFLNFE